MTNGQMDEIQRFYVQLHDTQNRTHQSHKHSPCLGNKHSTYYLKILAINLITGQMLRQNAHYTLPQLQPETVHALS